MTAPTFFVSGIFETVGAKFGINIGAGDLADGSNADISYGVVFSTQQTVTQFLNKHKGIYNYLILDDISDTGVPIIQLVRRAVNADLEIDSVVYQKDCIPQDKNSPALLYKRVDPMTLPRSVELQYISFDRGYAINTQYAVNDGARTQQAIMSVRSDFILSDVIARELAYDLLFRIWQQQLSITFEHPDLTIEPSDIVQVATDSGMYIIQIQTSMITKEPMDQSGIGRTNRLSGQLLMQRRGVTINPGQTTQTPGTSSKGTFHISGETTVVGVTSSSLDSGDGGGGTVGTSPTITAARPRKAAHSSFDIASGHTIKSNNLTLMGSGGSTGAVARVYLNGSLTAIGTAVVDSLGKWAIDLGVLADATYSAVVTQTVSGVESSPSAAFTFTIASLITTFSSTPSSTFTLGGDTHEVEGAGQSYSLTKPDSHTLRFEVRTGDRWAGGGDGTYLERSEVQNDTWQNAQSWGANIPANTPLNIYYELLVEPNSGSSFVNTQNISNGWFIIGQMHNDDTSGSGSGTTTSPPLAICMDGTHLQVLRRDCNSGLVPSNGAGNIHLTEAWRDTNPVVPSVYRVISIQTNFDNTGSGYLRVWVDGVQVVNYTGNIGFGYATYWEWGIYRSTATENAAVRYRNMLRS